MADTNVTAGEPVGAVVQAKLRQVGAIQEAIFRMVQSQHSLPDGDVMELAGLAGELVGQIQEELGLIE